MKDLFLAAAAKRGCDSLMARLLMASDVPFVRSFPSIPDSALPFCVWKVGPNYIISQNEILVQQFATFMGQSYTRAKIWDVLSSRGYTPQKVDEALVKSSSSDFNFKENEKSGFTRSPDVLNKVMSLGSLPSSKLTAQRLADNPNNFFRYNPTKYGSDGKVALRESISVIHSYKPSAAIAVKAPLEANLAIYFSLLSRLPAIGLSPSIMMTILAYESGGVVNQSLIELGALLGNPTSHSLTGKTLSSGISTSSTQVLMSDEMKNSSNLLLSRVGLKVKADPDSVGYNDPASAAVIGMINTFSYFTQYAAKKTGNVWGIYAGLAKHSAMLGTPIAANPMFLVAPLGKIGTKLVEFAGAGPFKQGAAYNSKKNVYDRAVFERCIAYVIRTNSNLNK